LEFLHVDGTTLVEVKVLECFVKNDFLIFSSFHFLGKLGDEHFLETNHKALLLIFAELTSFKDMTSGDFNFISI